MSTGDHSEASFVAAIPFCAHLGLTPSEESALALPESGTVRNHIGTVHAGALFTLGEAASGVTVMQKLGTIGASVVVAKSASIAFRKPARGRVSARGALREAPEAIVARLKADGKVTFEVHVVVTDAQAVEVATLIIEWYARA